MATFRSFNTSAFVLLCPIVIINLLASGEKALNYTIQVPDRMFYEARYASSLADQMATTGVIRPTSEMIKQAQKEALEAVYQDNS